MASQTAVSLPSSPPPSAQAYSAPADEQSPDPEEYETASDPEVDDTDTILPAEIVFTSSSTKKNEGNVHDSSQNGCLQEDYGSAMDLNDVILAVREKLGEGEKLSSVPQNPSGNDVSGRGDVAKSAETGDSQIEKVGSLSGENEQPVIYDTGVSQELNPKELGEGDTSFAAIEPKTSESSSSSSLNHNAFEELVPEVIKSESVVVVASGEVEDDAQRGDAADGERNDKSVKIDELLPAHNNVLEDNHVSVVAPTTDEVDAELHANGADKIESDVDDSKSTDDGLVVEGSKGEVNLLKGEAPGTDSINSTDEVLGEAFVGSPEMVNSESSKGTEEKLDRVYYNENSEGSYTLNPEIADEKEDVGFEDTSSHCEGETPSHIAKEAVVEDEITRKSSADAEILPVIAQENVVRNDSTLGTRTESTAQKSNTDKLDDTLNQESATENLSQKSVDDKVDELGFGEISKNTPNFDNANENVLVDSEHVSLNEETIEENTVVGSEDASSPGEDEPALQLIPDDGGLNSPIEFGTPMVAERSVLGVEKSEETTIQNLPTKCNTDKLGGIYLNEQSAEDTVVGSENPSSHSEGEPALQLIADEGDSKPAAEVETLPVTAEEIVVEDESAPQIPEFDQEVEPYVGESHVNDFKEETVEDEDEVKKIYDDPSVEVETPPATAKETVVGGQQKVESDARESQVIASTEEKSEDEDRKIYDDPAVEVETLPVTVKETAFGDGNVPHIPEFELKVEPDAGDSKEEKSGHEDEDRKVYDIPAVEVDNLSVAAKETVVGDESVPQIPELKVKEEADAEVSEVRAPKEEKDQYEDEDRKICDAQERVAILDGPDAAKQIIRELERISSSSHSSLQGPHNYSTNVEGQIVSDSDEVLDSDEEGEGGELFDSAALAALLKAATSSSDGTVTVTAQDAARIFSGDRPVGLGASAPSLRPSAPRSTRSTLFTPSETAAVEEPDHSMDDDEKRLHEKVEQIRVKFLRLVHRLGHSPADAVAGQVLYRLSLAEGIKQGRQMSRAFSIESAKKKSLQLEDEGKDDLDFSCNILVIGKTGVGKSATINSIFGEEKCQTNPFQLATASVREISGVVDGVRVRVIDTPGLKASISDQATNRKILSSIKKFTKKCPPDIVLYVDRMDTQTRDFNDLPLLRSITTILGSSIWFNAIVALTHAASAPPDGPNGSPLGYEVFVTQRSHVVQQSVRQAAGDMRLMNPVALVENHPSCRRNREGERILPNGLSWRPQLLLLSYASKILSEANSLLKLQEPSPGKLFGGFRLRSPPLPFLLSSLLQSRAHPKLSGDQGGDNADSDIDLDEFSDSEQEEEVDEYDQLPSFKPLKKSEIAMLTREQKKSYLDEYDYRVKLLQKKQWKDALRRMKEMKKKGKEEPDGFTNGDIPEYYDQDSSPAAVQVPVPDMVLPPSFDCDNPAFRYRFLEPTSQLLTRPVLDTHGWDHDCGYDGVSIEENLAIAGRFPTSMALQITKDKKEFNIHLDSSVAVKHGDHGSTLAGFDIQSVGKQLAYILRGETKFDNLKKHKTAAGISVTFLGETLATGLKVEDKVSINKRLGLVASTGAVRAQGDVAYGANLEVRLRDKDYPIGQALSTLGLSLMKWRSDLALGANLQSQFSVGRNSKMAVRVGLNNKLTGQITVRTSTSDYLQIAFAGIIPLAISIYRNIKSNESYMGH